MADTIKDLKIRLNVDGKSANVEFGKIGAAVTELKKALDEVKKAGEAARVKGDIFQVDALKAAGKEIDAAIEKMGRLRAAGRMDHARGLLDVRPFREIQREIDQARAAFARLAASGKLSAAELGQAYAHLQTRINELKSETNGWAKSIESVKGSLVALAGSFAAFGLGMRAAVGFETAMVGVQRAAGMSTSELKAMGAEFQRLSTRIAMPANDIARIAAMGARFGVARDELAKFAEITAVAARQFEMLPDEAGSALGILSRLLGVTTKDMDVFVGMVNALADSVGVAERDVIQTLTLAGSSAKEFGLSTGQATAMATTLLSVGATAQQAGTAMRTMLSSLRSATQDTGQAGQALRLLVGDVDAFARKIDTDAQSAVNDLLAAMSKLSAPDRFAATKALFGEGLDTENIRKLIGAFDDYKRAQDAASQSSDDYRAALKRLMDLDMGTLGAELTNLSNAATNLGQAFGQIFAPVVRAVAVALGWAAVQAKAFVDTFPMLSGLIGVIATLATGAGALRIAWGGLALLAGKLITSASGLLKPLASVGAAMTALGAGGPILARLGLAFRALLGPIGLVTTAIMLGVDAWNWWRKSAERASEVKLPDPQKPAASPMFKRVIAGGDAKSAAGAWRPVSFADALKLDGSGDRRAKSGKEIDPLAGILSNTNTAKLKEYEKNIALLAERWKQNKISAQQYTEAIEVIAQRAFGDKISQARKEEEDAIRARAAAEKDAFDEAMAAEDARIRKETDLKLAQIGFLDGLEREAFLADLSNDARETALLLLEAEKLGITDINRLLELQGKIREVNAKREAEEALKKQQDSLYESVQQGVQRAFADGLNAVASGAGGIRGALLGIVDMIRNALSNAIAGSLTDSFLGMLGGKEGVLNLAGMFGFGGGKRDGSTPTTAVYVQDVNKASGMKDVLGGEDSGVGGMFSGLMDGFTGMMSNLMSSLMGMLSSLMSGLGSGLSSIFSGIGGLFGFADGGYTGPGSKYQPAGVVHAGEYVFSQAAVRRLGIAALDNMHRMASGAAIPRMPRWGYADGGAVNLPAGAAPTVNSTTKVINMFNLDSAMSEYLRTRGGERAILNIIQRNPGAAGA